ncbi:MAG TPA: nucleotidyltransferase family protein [Gemmatimonadaceae bacterium]|nr:nucleotidyltransferase family protein [Gemmatimonadaceae bacterium]
MAADRPEHQLLRLSITRRFAPVGDAEVARLLAGPLDWTYVVWAAHRQQIMPLLDDCLSAVGTGVVPPASLKTLAQRAAMIRMRNRQLARELIHLHRAAAGAGIRLLSFKGPVLAVTLYGDLALRQFGDLDLLVDRASSPRAEELLATLGYRRTRDFGFEVSFVNGATRIAVDLHRALSADNFPVAASFDDLWQRRQKVALEGGYAETLSTPDVLIAMCIEAARDARQGQVKLSKMSDLVHALRAASDVEWAEVQSRARRLGLRRVLWFGIELAAGVLEMPAARDTGLDGPPRLIPFLREVEASLFRAPGTPRPTQRHGDRFHFLLRERWRDRLLPYALRVHRLVTPNVHDRRVIALPRPLAPLYYLVRPVRLMRRYGGARGKRAGLAGGSPPDLGRHGRPG